MVQSVEEWLRIYTDNPNGCYRRYPAPVGRYGEPQFPDFSDAKIFRLGFRDKGRLLDSTEHVLFTMWTGRDSN
jgi:hypothetical protein